MAWVFHFLYPVYYTISAVEIKQEQKTIIKNGEETANYRQLSFTSTFFNAHYNKAEKELEINGEMYDVVNIVRNGDIVKCIVLNDDNESRLNTTLALHFGHEKTDKNTHQLLLWCPVAVGPDVNYVLPVYSDINTNNYTIIEHQYLSNGYGQLAPRPPQTI
ncbi:MAG: hypothetical protein JSS96_04535 [Bacteroidetes bacterium]|nr:hypothetical protein [Bacteroidota bacterium]